MGVTMRGEDKNMDKQTQWQVKCHGTLQILGQKRTVMCTQPPKVTVFL